MERKKRLFSCALVILGAMMMIPHTTKGYEKKQEDYSEEQSGIPDVVNSVTLGTDHHLTVIANSDKIEEKEEFARTVIHMCQDNSFHSVRFSTDIRGYPSELDIDVFLNRKDVEERKEPVCKIKFKTDDFSKGYNIKDNPDKFHLFLDEKEIEFY
ncbi:hypothetical protein [Sporofaciens musculi]|jgi:hypothetical protein|uniref:hypothetical protein n=1 Tax=Sporofaciens musculi TaxID=2681861 RepID=UPI002582BD0B|nr:hypothetical protein [Sporofaciens musculi]